MRTKAFIERSIPIFHMDDEASASLLSVAFDNT